MKRRSFIATTAAAGIGTQVLGGVPLRAYSPMRLLDTLEDDNRTLIVIQMFGGNDGLNTIIPAEDDEYFRIRPNLSVPASAAKKVLSRIYMHPALDPDGTYNLRTMLEDGRLAVIQGIGYENPNLSHFRSTDIWLSGFNSSDPDKRLIDGWLGRYWSQRIQGFPETLPDHPTAVQIGGTLSMLLQSPKGDIGIALTDPDAFFRLGQGLSPDLQPIPEDTRYGREFNFVRLVAEQSDKYSSIIKNAFDAGKNTLKYADNGFVRQMQLVARLISGGLRSKIFMVYLGGFDTHVNQQDEKYGGLHPYLLESLSTGIGQFMQDALAQGFADNVVGLTVSEFGRRPYENGSRGTDHGAGSVQFVWGNGVKAGVYGNNPNLKDLDSNGDVRYQWDYRRVYADVMETWFGGTPSDTEAVLEERVLPLGVLQRPTSVSDPSLFYPKPAIKVYPNPVTAQATLEWYQPVPASVAIDLYTSDGRFAEAIYKGRVDSGLFRHNIQARASGAYICNVVVNGVPTQVPIRVLH